METSEVRLEMPTRWPRDGARWAVRRAEPDAKMSLVNVNVKKNLCRNENSTVTNDSELYL